MTPAQALETATSVAAEAVGLASEIGTLEVGKAADLVLVNGNPLKEIAALREPGGLEHVFRGGVDVTRPWPALGF